MKKIILLTTVLTFVLTACSKTTNQATSANELVIYAYDSFTSEWGPGPTIVKQFEEKYGIKVKLIDFGDAGSVLTKAISEKDNPSADIIIGIDNNMLAKAVEADLLEKYNSNLLNEIPDNLLFSRESGLVPFDYGFFSIIYDTQAIKNPPKSLEDLTKQEYKDSLIIMDPRTSSPGLGFLLWTISIYGENYLDYWNRLKPSILTITDGWSSGYGLFTEGEAPMVLSYTTSPAYHVEFEESNRYQAVTFNEGNYMQLEGVGIIKGSKNRLNANVFIDYMLSKEAQSVIPLTNFMFPVNSSVDLPQSFDYALKPEKSLQLDYEVISENYDKWLKEWSENSVE